MFRVFDLLNGAKISAAYIEDALKHGVVGIHVTVNNFSKINPRPSLVDSLRELASIRAHYRSLEQTTLVVERFADFAAAQKAGKLAVVLGYQNVPGVERDLELLELFHGLGVRVIQVAHNIRNIYADGCNEAADAGLSTLGKELIAELNRLSIIIDLSHVGNRSGIEACATSKQPVAVTHANAFSIHPNVRNKHDALLDAVKANGGVVGITYLPPLVAQGAPGHADVLKHVRHIVQRIGVPHLGIGSDFIAGQPAERYAEFMRSPEVYGTWPWRFPVNDNADQQNLLASMRSLNLGDAEIQAVACDNFMRLFRQVFNKECNVHG
jgi:membrane dipeptidase